MRGDDGEQHCASQSADIRQGLDLDVAAHFQHPLMGDFEEVGGPARDAGEERVDREGHRRHRRTLCAADHDFMGDVIVHLMQICLLYTSDAADE